MLHVIPAVYFVFFKQKSAYEMRISDWSSDVCSSDLATVASSTKAPVNSTQPVAIFASVEGSRPRRASPAHRASNTGVPTRITKGLTAWRSEERRVGKEGVSACRSRWNQCH